MINSNVSSREKSLLKRYIKQVIVKFIAKAELVRL